MIAWIDAESGTLINKFSEIANKNAPTADFGIQNMNDSEIDGGLTQLSNDRLIVYDNSLRFFGLSAPDISPLTATDIPVSLSNVDWDVTHGDPEVFQLFWMTDQILNIYQQNLNINFVDVRAVYHSGFGDGAIVFPNSLPEERTTISFGTLSGLSTVEYDIIAHKLGHAVVFQFFGYTQIENRSLHEGLAYILGTYVESILEPYGIDWIMGDNMPATIRDLENTTRNCYTDIKNLTAHHDRGEALGY